MKKYTLGFLILSAVASAVVTPAGAETQGPLPVLVCRAHQCASAPHSMTKGFLFNKIAQMFQNNLGKSVLMCEADPASHVCLEEGLLVPAQTAFSETDIRIDGMKLVDEKLVRGETALDAVFDYRVQANDTFPTCQLGLTRLTVDFLDKVEMVTQDMACQITETGRTAINATYAIDYLDFDYGFIGAYYTLGVGEAVRGDKSGYVLMRFTHRPAAAEPVVEEVVTVEAETVPVAAAPAILQETAPEVTEEPAAAVTETETVTEVRATAETPAPLNLTKKVTETVETVTKVSAPVPPPKPTVIKTTVVEKTVITSDGKRKITPPEKRTLINGEEQPL